MKNDTKSTEPTLKGDLRWQLIPVLSAGLAGLSGLVIAIIAGLQTDNAPITILVRGLIAMGGCWITGYVAGYVVRRAVLAESSIDHHEDSGDSGISDDSAQSAHSAADSQLAREAA